MEQDYDTITRWIEADIFHFGKMDANWWLPRPDALYSFCVEDDKGAVLFIRIDKEQDIFRFHMQFPPTEEIGKLRVAKTLLKIFNPLIDEFKQGGKGIVFQSTNDPLIKFMIKKGFQPVGNDDYLLQWETGVPYLWT